MVSTISNDYQVFGVDSIQASGGTAFLVHRSVTVGGGQEISPKFIWRSFALGNDVFHLAAIHAPNESQLRMDFWRQVSDTLPDLSFILLGDFNNVETAADSSSRRNRMGTEEQTTFFQMCGAHNLFDCWMLATTKLGPRWTRFERRSGVFSWARLDRIYPAFDQFMEDELTLVHHIAFQLSDHLPVSMLVKTAAASQEMPRSFYFKADLHLLRKPEVKCQLKEVWLASVKVPSQSPLETFAQAWTMLRQETKLLQYQEVSKLSDLAKLQKELEELTAVQHGNDADLEKVMELSQEVARLQAWQHYRWRVWSREKFLHLGETNSPYFLRKFRLRRKKARIPMLVTADGVQLVSDSDILEEVFTHYSTVFSADPPLTDLQRQTSYLHVFSGKVSVQQQAFMDDLPTAREFSELLFSSAKGFLEGVITLVPKVEGAQTVSALRPITLLSTVYKLFAKLIAARLAFILPSLVSVQQQGFVAGRSVYNNVLTFTLLHEILKRERRTASFLMIDFARAFDSLRHDFLFLGLEALGFSVRFVTLIKALTESGYARVVVNNRATPEFPLGTGVRQGCPLAPLLFVLISSALTIHAEDAVVGNF
ncbi:hypothetical protein R1sor_014608 [Riccia sorocarpa]|uniref:Reverse transcriptase domain-containing protein n=1 Tax=Riccia sorocarpa TaxID=122646 RepID=A0ABD3HDR4_9MARC